MLYSACHIKHFTTEGIKVSARIHSYYSYPEEHIDKNEVVNLSYRSDDTRKLSDNRHDGDPRVRTTRCGFPATILDFRQRR